MSEDVWTAVQERLDEPSRVSNRSGSTARKHIGSGLYICGVCDKRVRAHSSSYRCAGHIQRQREALDAFVLEAIRIKLAGNDLKDLLVQADLPRVRAISTETEALHLSIRRAERDYDAGTIEAADLKRIRD
ncbi:MAG: zinc ribbon domain-containing protein, partial [Actinomycetales bacterium]